MGIKPNMEARAHITAEMVSEILFYDPSDGSITWTCPRSNRCKPGDNAAILNNGRFSVMVFGLRVPASHIAWLVTYGKWPEKEVDHSDRDPLNNKVSNLRESKTMQNCMNQGKRAINTSGYKGVTAHLGGWWWSRISADGKRYHLGLYPEPWMAAAAYRIAAAGMHGEFMGV